MNVIEVILETGSERRKVIRKAVEALGEELFSRCREAWTILIKVNLVDHQIQLASTHIDAVRGLIDVLQIYSPAKIYIGDAAYRGTDAAFRAFGYEHLLKEYNNVELVDLNEDEVEQGYSIRRDGTQNPIRMSRLAKNADLKISLTPMKVHADAGMSLGVMNWTLGTWVVPSRVSATGRVWARWPWLDEEGPEAYHRTIAELYKQSRPDIAVVDGVVAMEGEGPVRGSAVEMGVVLAGFDPVAVDAVATTLAGIDPSQIGYLSLCHDAGLGSIDLTRINVPPMQMAQYTRRFDRPLGFEDRLMWRSS